MQAYNWGESAKPFLKWAGSKRYLLPKILPRLPEKIGTYFEPFLGGGAVFFALAAEGRFNKAVVGDANEALINVYGSLIMEHSGRVGPDALILELKKHANAHSREHYYAVRASRPRSDIAQAARFIYLNRTCFNGLYRVNRKGEFNVPMGSYANPTICDEENLRSVSKTLLSLKSLRVLAKDFRLTVKGARKGDAVYFDSPYVPLSKTSDFTAYVKGGFDEAAHVRLRDCFKALDERGVHVLLSNSDTPFVRLFYKGFHISEVKAPRRINSKGGKRGNVSELLISGRNAR